MTDRTEPLKPQPNLPLLRKVLDFVRQNPDAHDQGKWGYEAHVQPSQSSPCGTAMCIAGWAMYFDGSPTQSNGQPAEYVSTQAARTLGLTESERLALFFADDYAEALTVSQDIAARVGEVL